MPAASPSSLHAQREDKQVEMQFSDTVGLPVIKSYDCLQHRRVTWSYLELRTYVALELCATSEVCVVHDVCVAPMAVPGFLVFVWHLE